MFFQITTKTVGVATVCLTFVLVGCASSRNHLAENSVGSKVLTTNAVGMTEAQPVGAESTALSAQETDLRFPQIRLLAVKTDVAKRYRWVVPPFPFPPFPQWRRWYREHEDAVHCGFEWCDDKGQWFNGEMRSTHFDVNAEQYRVGWGEFPGTAYDAYGVYIRPGRFERLKDSQGRPLVVTVDEKIDADYRVIEAELRRYAAKDKCSGDEGTGGTGKKNVGLGGPAYKPAQNSNTMACYILQKAGVHRPSPDRAVGWGRQPDFPYSSDTDSLPKE